MKWHGISGSWRNTNRKVKKDVEKTIEGIVLKGEGIITGGALGVDYIATQKFLEVVDDKEIEDRLKIFLPVRLEDYCIHFYRRAEEGVITRNQADKLSFQLTEIREFNPKSIIDDSNYLEVNKESYFARINKIVEASDDVYAFHVNNSEGTRYSIEYAEKLDKPVYVKRYIIKESKVKNQKSVKNLLKI